MWIVAICIVLFKARWYPGPEAVGVGEPVDQIVPNLAPSYGLPSRI
jgi:hypothetical protein